MKDELHIFCKLEGMDEVYLRSRMNSGKRLLRLEKKRNKNKERSCREYKSPGCFTEPDEG